MWHYLLTIVIHSWWIPRPNHRVQLCLNGTPKDSPRSSPGENSMVKIQVFGHLPPCDFPSPDSTGHRMWHLRPLREIRWGKRLSDYGDSMGISWESMWFLRNFMESYRGFHGMSWDLVSFSRDWLSFIRISWGIHGDILMGSWSTKIGRRDLVLESFHAI